MEVGRRQAAAVPPVTPPMSHEMSIDDDVVGMVVAGLWPCGPSRIASWYTPWSVVVLAHRQPAPVW